MAAKIQDLISVEKQLSTDKGELVKKYTSKMRKMDDETRLHLEDVNQKVSDRGTIIATEVEKMTKDLKNQEKVSIKTDPKKSEHAKTMIKAAFEKLLAA